MSDTECRRKMISLRLSEDEYEALKKRYRAYGVRNVSELARLALQLILNGPDDPQDASATTLAQLDDRVHALESQRR